MNLKRALSLGQFIFNGYYKQGNLFRKNPLRYLGVDYKVNKSRCLSTSIVCLGPPKVKQAIHDSDLWLKISFDNGHDFKFLFAWLRDECKCPLCWDAARRFKRSNSWLPDIDIQPKSLAITSDGKLEITWPNHEHKSIYNPEWLIERSRQMLENKMHVTRDTSHRPSMKVWSKKVIDENELPREPFENFMSNQIVATDFMHLFYRYGFGILYNTPLEKKSIVNFANRVAYIRASSFGTVSEVFFGPESGLHPAYAGDEIKLHTDLPYREKSPGILCMHCVKAADPESSKEHAGGQTILADGYQVSQWLQKHNPSAYQLLSTIPIPYSYFDPVTGVTYSSYWPVIGLDPLGELNEIHFSNFARKTLNYEPELTLQVYSALKCFCDRLENCESQIKFYLHSGDLLVINNRRVLHARTGFDPQKVQRHMRTIYMDLDELLGTYDAVLKHENKKVLHNVNVPPKVLY